jgi:hypothetical protein
MGNDRAALAVAFLSLTDVFGAKAAENTVLRDGLIAALRELQDHGALAAAARLG